MNLKSKLARAFGALLLLAGASIPQAIASPVLVNYAPGFYNGAASAFAPSYLTSTYFTLNNAATIDGFNWWGSAAPPYWRITFYGSQSVGGGTPTVDYANIIQVFEFERDLADLDLAVIIFDPFANVTWPISYEYTPPTTFELEANTGYFVSIETWGWGSSWHWLHSTYGLSYQRTAAWEAEMIFRLAMQIEGIERGVPEPAPIALLIVGLGLMAGFMRHRKNTA